MSEVPDYAAMLEVAIAEARAGLAEGGIPIGAAVFDANGKLIGVGHNRRVQNGDPSTHGETDAFRNAGRQRSYRNLIMVTTLAPCWYCSGLVRQFGFRTLVVGESRNFAGGLDWLRSLGIQVIDLDSAECARLHAGILQNVRRRLIQCTDEVVVFQRHIFRRSIPVALLPIIVLEIEVIFGPSIAFVIIAMAAAPIVVVRVKDDIMFGGDIVASVVGINAVSAAQLVINHIAHEFFTVRQRRAGQPLRVNSAAIGEQLHVIKNQIVLDQVVVRIIRHPGALDFVRPAAPAHRNTRVGQMIQLIVGNHRVLRVTDINADATVIFRRHIVDMIVCDVIVARHLSRRPPPANPRRPVPCHSPKCL